MTSSKPVSLTDQQDAAITTRHVSVSLSAGAGCGKTFVLTRRFLSHLEPRSTAKKNAQVSPRPRTRVKGAGDEGAIASCDQPLPPGTSPRSTGARGEFETRINGDNPDPGLLSGLVAITFTERAAREMRERIRKACFDRLRACSTDDVHHWLRITREIDSARVSTIHSFCASVLRSAAVEARLDPQFGLLDPQLGPTFRRNAVKEALHTAVASQLPAACEVVRLFGLDQTIGLCEALVLKRFELQLDRWLRVAPEELGELWKAAFQTCAPGLLIAALQASREVAAVYELLQTHCPTHAVMADRCAILTEELSRLRTQPASIADPATWLQIVRENATVQGGGSKKAWDTEEIYEQVRDTFERFRKALDKFKSQFEFVEEDVLPAATLSLQVLELAALAIDQYELRKTEAAVLDFDDLLIRTRDLLRDHPNVRKRLTAGIDSLMVDEFQDTDPVQAEIVRLICGDKLTTGKLFLVGDAQQSIYRFRRADPEVFRKLRTEIPPAGRLPLNQNFRSQPAILNFVNALFDGTFGDIFQALVPAVEQMTPEPAIEFLFSTSDNDTTENAEARRREEAQWMACRIRELLADTTPRIRRQDPATGVATLRPIQPGDIVILFRALSDVRHYELALRECRLEYYLVGGQAFYAQQEVYDVLNLLRTLNEPDDEISLLGVLRSPFFGLTDDSLLTLVRCTKSLEQGLENPPFDELSESQRPLVAQAAVIILELRRLKDRVPLAELLNRALDLTAYDASLVPEFLGRRKLANLRKLIEMARQFDQAGGLTLSDFIERLKGAVTEETDEELAATQAESSNVIRLMTIHQSKGLEFPVVIVADMDRGSPSQSDVVEFNSQFGPLVKPPKRFGRETENIGLRLHRWQEQEAEADEHLRMLYVALTRAADYLILSAGVKDLNEVKSGWMTLLASRFDLPTGLPKLDPLTQQPVIPAPHAATCPKILVHRVPPRTPLLPPAIHDGLPLNQFRELVAQAEPLPIPDLVLPVQADRGSQRTFSVSQLEVIDEELHQAPHASVLQPEKSAVRGENASPHPLTPSPVQEPPSTGARGAATFDQLADSLEATQAPRSLHASSAAGASPSHDALTASQSLKQATVVPTTETVRSEDLGTLVHGVLERMDQSLGAEQISNLLDACWTGSLSTLPPETKQAASEMLDRFWHSECIVELKTARQCLRELEFNLRIPQELLPGEPRCLSGKIDCLFESATGDWIIYDYKTGDRFVSQDASAMLRHYEFQLGVYAWAVRDGLGVLPAHVAIVTFKPQLTVINLPITAATIDAIQARAARAVAAAIQM